MYGSEISILLYADNIILPSPSEKNAINALGWCKKWKLFINKQIEIIHLRDTQGSQKLNFAD